MFTKLEDINIHQIHAKVTKIAENGRKVKITAGNFFSKRQQIGKNLLNSFFECKAMNEPNVIKKYLVSINFIKLIKLSLHFGKSWKHFHAL